MRCRPFCFSGWLALMRYKLVTGLFYARLLGLFCSFRFFRFFGFFGFFGVFGFTAVRLPNADSQTYR